MRRRKYKAEPAPASSVLRLLDAWSRQSGSARAELVAELRASAAALHKTAGEVVALSDSTLAADLGESARARALARDLAAELLDACAVGLPLRVVEIERLAIVEALRRSHLNTALAARLLGVGRATLYRRLQREQSLQTEAAGQPTPPAELAVQADADTAIVVVFGHRLDERAAQAIADQIYVALGRLAGREANQPSAEMAARRTCPATARVNVDEAEPLHVACGLPRGHSGDHFDTSHWTAWDSDPIEDPTPSEVPHV